MSGIGYVVAAAQLGLSAIKVKPKRKIGAFTATVTEAACVSRRKWATPAIHACAADFAAA